MTALQQMVLDIEARLSVAGVTVNELCAEVGINRSTWQRWKNGTYKEIYISTHERVLAAADRVAPQE